MELEGECCREATLLIKLVKFKKNEKRQLWLRN